MPKLTLSLENLSEVKGGLVAAMVDKGLARIAEDIERAPDIAEWRKVTLEIKAKPILDQGELENVAVEFVVKPTTPSRVTSARMEIKHGQRNSKQLVFNVDAIDNPNQSTITDMEGVE